MKTRAVITVNLIDRFGEKVTCNMIESLDKTLGRIESRISDLKKKGFTLTGNLTIQFVVEDC